MRFSHASLVAGALVAMASPYARAQQQPAAPSGPRLDGVLYANYQYGGTPDARSDNRFELERAYLTFRATAGDRVSVRVTADVFQQRTSGPDAYYRGWVVRAKFAYLQYDYLAPEDPAHGVAANARLGMLNTVLIEHVESFWPRWVQQVATERAGFFSPADLGAATTITLPNRAGEVYATITNGPGYTSRETDRFKDAAVRATFTPLGSRATSRLRTLAISPWIYKGARASDFTRRTGTVLAQGYALQRDRVGIFAGLRDSAFTAGAEYGRQIEDAESADTTRDVAPRVTNRDGSLYSAFAWLRPFARNRAHPLHSFGAIARFDHSEPTSQPAGRHLDFYLAGLTADLSTRAALALTLERQIPHAYNRALDTSTIYLKAMAAF